VTDAVHVQRLVDVEAIKPDIDLDQCVLDNFERRSACHGILVAGQIGRIGVASNVPRAVP
jgi:hypothetical protein